jgi:branched-chain amino acid transport system permease protein
VSLVQAVVDGLLTGGIYASLAMGLSIVFGIMRIVNIAHAAIALTFSYVAYILFKELRLDPLLSIPVIVPLALLLAIGMHWGLIRPVMRRGDALMSLLLLFGFANVLEGVIAVLWGGDVRMMSTAYSTTLQFGPLSVSIVRLVGFAGSAAIILALWAFLRLTHFGRAILGTIQNATAATLMGVNTDRILRTALIIGIVTAVPGGVFLALTFAFYPSFHYVLIGKLFCIVVIGGLGSLNGALVGALLLGVAEAVTGSVLRTAWAELVAYSLLIMTLLVRPSGLFGEQS